jgi:phenylalanyl-tRNA synthetase beta chain
LPPHAPIFLFEREVRTQMTALGLQEFLTCDLIGPKLLSVVKEDPVSAPSTVKVMNPTSIEQSILRESLLPGLLEVVKYNVDHENPDVHGFEIGRVHFRSDDLYKEQSVAGIILTGKDTPPYFDPKSRPVDFYDLKGIVEGLLKGIGLENYECRPSHLEMFHPGRQAAIYAGGIQIGSMGEVHPQVQRRLDVPQRILFAEISLHDLYPLRKTGKRMQPLPVYPCTERDWTLTLPEHVTIQFLFDQIHASKSKLLEEVSLVAIYRNEKLGADKKNVTLHFVYRDNEKTISQESADAEHGRIVAAAAHRLGIPIPVF